MLFAVDDAAAEAIRRAFDELEESAAVVEFRQRFPYITNMALARQQVRIIASWQPIAPPSGSGNEIYATKLRQAVVSMTNMKPLASQTVSAVIRSRMAALTGASRALGAFVAEHPEAVAFMAAKTLGEATGSSDAAVIRFAQALGYAGFLELRAALRQELLEKTGAIAFAEGTLRGAGGDDLVAEVFCLDAMLVRRTQQINDRRAYGRIAERLVRCRRVWVVGHGTSAPLATYLATGLNQALADAKALTIGQADLSEELRDLGPQDAMFGIGYVRYLPYTVDLLALARRRKAAVFAITDSLASPLAALADETLLAARDSTTFNVSQIGTVSIAHALVSAVAWLAADALRERLRGADRIWEELELWSAANEDDDNGEAPAAATTGRPRRKKDRTR